MLGGVAFYQASGMRFTVISPGGLFLSGGGIPGQPDNGTGHLEIPDAGVQALLDSSIRNIYQAREIKQGLPAFQVGPTCYRGLWVVDGSFLLEAITYLGRANETRNGVKYLMSFQRDDGSYMLMDGH